MTDKKTSIDSIAEANRERGTFSGHGDAKGAAGLKESSYDPDNAANLREPGQCVAVSPGPDGFKAIRIGASWDNVEAEKSGIVGKILKKTMKVGVDIDLGCIYELQDGTRGAIQAFGEKFGSYDSPPYMKLTGDERTGDKKGMDEAIIINGAHWDKIKSITVYLYIYDGVANWAEANPRIVVDIPGEEDLYVTLSVYKKALCICAIGGLENVRNGIKLTNHTEYFPGHEEMDRAFGFGLQWDDGKKD